MKLFAIICVCFVAAATANPLFQNEEIGEEFVNEEVGEEFVNEPEVVQEDNTEDWQLVPDTDGNLHLVDIREMGDEVTPSFNAPTDIVFRLFTRQNPTAAQTVPLNNNAVLNNSNYNPALQTRFHIHGWNGGGAATGAAIRNAWINAINCNVFTVDWGAGAQTPNYVLARNRVNAVGAVIASYIDWLNQARGQSFAAVSIAGHSLGAHCAGAAGKRTARGRVQSIVSLDPAGPLFTVGDSANRVHFTDAVHVENIVTDAGNLGFAQPVGHANFYPNWGVNQPGCAGSTCSHSRVNDFFQHSINMGNVFGATRCRDFADITNRNCVSSGAGRRMGGEPVIDGTSASLSVFFLTTGASAPFAHGPR
ncbi:phospholipase A1-like [Bradysia coprophila]|uniref:phospholipase A1-like n=1 Tax=Bradysia coprophila TaxID=38358 RepID=UPI00187D9045|nr:phospholipase A1-like [Bradysia coprophila]